MGCGVICSMVMEEKHSRLICCDCIITCIPRLGVTRRLGTVSKCRAFATSRWHSILEIPVCHAARSGCKAWRIVRTCSLFPAFCTIMAMLFYRLLARSLLAFFTTNVSLLTTGKVTHKSPMPNYVLLPLAANTNPSMMHCSHRRYPSIVSIFPRRRGPARRQIDSVTS